jgi:hypothetical protein
MIILTSKLERRSKVIFFVLGGAHYRRRDQMFQ